MTTLMITHNMEDAIQYGQKIIIMSEGRILDFIDEKRKQKFNGGRLDSSLYFNILMIIMIISYCNKK